MTKIESWIKQPTTITGIAAFVATVAGVTAKLLTHDTTLATGIGGIVYAAVHTTMPDNTGLERPVEKLVSDAVEAAVTKQWRTAAPALFSDGMAVLGALQPVHPAPVAPAPAPTQGTTP